MRTPCVTVQTGFAGSSVSSTTDARAPSNALVTAGCGAVGPSEQAASPIVTIATRVAGIEERFRNADIGTSGMGLHNFYASSVNLLDRQISCQSRFFVANL